MPGERRQPVPKVADADVERVVSRDFGAEHAPAALAILATYGRESWHREICRVRLAALKLAGGDIRKLQEAVKVASNDYRDVLAGAEYPTYSRSISPTEPDAAKRDHAIDSDWQAYRAWWEKK